MAFIKKQSIMTKRLFSINFIIFLLFSTNTFSQVEFETIIGEQYDEQVSTIVNADNNSYIISITSFPPGQYSSSKLTKISSDGEVILQKDLAKPDTASLINTIISSYTDNGYFAIGKLHCNDKKWLWMLEFDNDFNIISENKFLLLEDITRIGRMKVVKKNFKYYIAYYSYIPNHVWPITKLCMFNPEDNSYTSSEWSIYGFIWNLVDNPNNENLLLSGHLDYRDSRFLMYEINYQLEIVELHNSFEHDIYHMTDCKWYNNNKLIHTGSCIYSEHEDTRFMAIQTLDSNFNAINFKTFGVLDVYNYAASYNSIAIADNMIYYGGTRDVVFNSFPETNNYLPVIKLDSDLNKEWTMLLGGDAYYIMSTICPTEEGGCVIAGTRFDSNTQNHECDVYIAKLGPNCVTNTGTLELSANISLYPNPGNSIINIETEENIFTFEFYDAMGKKVLQSQNQKTINVNNINSGIYFYRFIKNNTVQHIGKWIKE